MRIHYSIGVKVKARREKKGSGNVSCPQGDTGSEVVRRQVVASLTMEVSLSLLLPSRSVKKKQLWKQVKICICK